MQLPKVKIGSAMLHRPQRFERRDRWPDIPFAEEYKEMPSLRVVVQCFFAIVAFFVMIYILQVAYG